MGVIKPRPSQSAKSKQTKQTGLRLVRIPHGRRLCRCARGGSAGGIAPQILQRHGQVFGQRGLEDERLLGDRMRQLHFQSVQPGCAEQRQFLPIWLQTEVPFEVREQQGRAAVGGIAKHRQQLRAQMYAQLVWAMRQGAAMEQGGVVEGFHHGASFLEHLDLKRAVENKTPALVNAEDGFWSVVLKLCQYICWGISSIFFGTCFRSKLETTRDFVMWEII